MYPDDVREITAAVSKILAKSEGFVEAIRAQRAQPTDCFDRVQDYDHSLRSGEVDDAVGTVEIEWIWRRKIVNLGERRDPINCGAVRIASGAIITQEIDPQRINAVAPAIVYEKRSFRGGKLPINACGELPTIKNGTSF